MNRPLPKRPGSLAAAVSPETGLRLSRTSLWRTWALFGWAATIVGAVWGLRWLEQYVRATRTPVACQLTWVNLPPWLTMSENDWVLQDITRAAALQPDDDLYDPNLCGRMGTGLLTSPWVAKVERVGKQADGMIAVRAIFREPAACVEKRGRVFLVDQAGVRLPQDYPANSVDLSNPSSLLLITGVAASPPAIGAVWAGQDDPNQPAPDLVAGLKLVEHLREAATQGRLPFRSSLRAIDVGNYYLKENAFDGKLRLRTISPRCYVRWGEPPGSEYPVEPSASRKLDMLRSLYAEQGQFPDGQILDVRKEEGIEVRPFSGR